VGERLSPLQLSEPWYVVLARQSGSAPGKLRGPELKRDSLPVTLEDFLDGRTTNVCERSRPATS